ncbi:MAG: hypothetical protein IPG34_12815 [Rhodocyclaceae bacterium]|nr:hypothetical protein [Rhodocyclaceae bacterium]
MAVRLQGVARGIVGEFGAAEGEDEFVGRGVPEQRAGESRFGKLEMPVDRPVIGEMGNTDLGLGEAASAFVADFEVSASVGGWIDRTDVRAPRGYIGVDLRVLVE